MAVNIEYRGEIAVVTLDNPPVNALSRAVRQALFDATEALDADPSVKAVVLACAGRTFIAGADVGEFEKPPEPPHLPDLVERIERAEKPWIAAIHGSALGGGFEVALGCRFRVAVPSANIGLPEVRLGIVPGAGGTVRLPRLAGVEMAVDMVTTGKPLVAPEAAATGVIDALIEDDLVAGAVAFARQVLGRPLPNRLRDRAISAPSDTFWDAAAKAVAARARGEEAPPRALACLRRAAEQDFDAAIAFERETFLALRGSAQAAALRHVFFAERAATRPPELAGTVPVSIRSAAVIGGGTMGVGIAAALRDANLPVTLVERDAAALGRGVSRVRGIFDSAVKRGRIAADVAAERMAGVTATTDYAGLADVDLVIEAVFEDLEVKRDVFQRLAAVCRYDAVLATNTSYLDPETIAEGIGGPERFLGLHFFSPAHVMKLLEIVPAKATAPEVLATGFALARMLGKIPVRAGTCDGFIGNRMLKVTRAQAERLLLSGATPAAVDAAMRGFGLPMGPFEAQDLGGLDIAALQRQTARTRGETPFAPIADRLCAQERFGQKSGGGWYDYAPGDRTPRPSDTVSAIIAEAAEGYPRREWDEASIVSMIVWPMVNEGARILEDKTALRASDVDLVKIHGYGFPRWRGGPMHYAEAHGLDRVIGALDAVSSDGLADPACEFLLCAAARGGFSACIR
ncbi:Enoyl-CoA hydratase (plasmid) [Sinorhizobium sojae CCBAU 05684]|uniref:Enoyl-CoA hydratase n=1 Tax=Sinorhizobium sojae CCBAU 05684 TaxID=716928 RepID=A0A249PJ07_9HYPH|nr:3-hydroxyacyl-CoA dehydrogenase NAD-binding domain-containing protein [Sinorhizobium sojae]ASY65722.1 Enoyl-CoA hydratase [Sinorhizobium sojae CCBAU 05684]